MHPDLQRYLKENLGKFSTEELHTKLLAAGYPAEMVVKGLRKLSSSREPVRGALLTHSKVLDALVGFGLSFLFWRLEQAPTLSNSLAFISLLGYLFLFTATTIFLWERYPYISRGLLATVVIVLSVTGADFFSRPTASWWTD